MVCAESDLDVFILIPSCIKALWTSLCFLFSCFYCLWASEHYWWDITDQLEFMIFFCCVILLLKPCKQRANTSGTRVNTLVCIWMTICMDSYSQHLCKCKLIHVKGCGKGNKKTESKWHSWKCLFSIIYPVPFIFSIAQGFRNGPHHVQECFWYKAFWFNQIAEGKNSSSEWRKCQAIVSSQYS